MNIINYHAFGWIIQRVSTVAGEEFDIDVRRTSGHSRLSAQTIYTKGLITGVQSGDASKPAATRAPGFGNDMLPNPVPAGVMRMTTQEPAEWWCLNLPTNKTLPTVGYIRLSDGESMQVAAGDLIYICAGGGTFGSVRVDGPISVRVANNTTLTAVGGAIYGMKFESENPTTTQ
jgi:hypothetical protein